MNYVTAALQSFFNIFKFHKKKILAFLLFVILFAAMIFPFDDLTDLMTTKVAEATNNSVYVQADGMSLHWVPTPGVKLTSALVQLPNLPNISSDELSVSPSLLTLLRGAVGAQIEAKGLFKGDVDLSYEEGEKTKDGQRTQKIKLNANELALTSVSNFLRDMNVGDFKLNGALSASGNAKIDPSYEEQPNGLIELSLKNFVFPAYTIYMQGAPMFNLPELKFKKSFVKTQLAEGKMQIDDITLGDDKDELSCKLKGEVTLKMVKGRPSPDFGPYNLSVEIRVQQKFYDQNSVLFALLQPSFKKAAPGGQKFSFKVTGTDFTTPGRFTDF